MEIKRRTEVLIETHRQIVVHDSESLEQIVCPQCGETMLTAEHAAPLTNLSNGIIAHFVEAEPGALE
jgi:predicted RNA-binding Zn-ribbon protein involved in translation (DUF1610 family)